MSTKADLITALQVAHEQSTWRENPSTHTLAVAARANGGNFPAALAAALLTLGGNHAPLVETYDLLAGKGHDAWRLLEQGKKVPGWGNGFVKGQPDPIWQPVDEILRALAPELAQTMDCVTRALHDKGKIVFPNPSAFTAAAGIVLGVPRLSVPYLFIQGRLRAFLGVFEAVVAEDLKQPRQTNDDEPKN